MKINITFENNETISFDSGTLVSDVAKYYQAYILINQFLGPYE